MARPRTFVEDDVLAAARDQFWSRGYAATSVDDLAEVTGLGKGSLYGAFGDKHSLFMRALGSYCTDAVDGMIEQLTRPGVPAVDRLAAHVRTVAADIAADTERRGCLMTRSSAELGAADPEVDRVVSRSLTRWRDQLVDILDEAVRDGAVRADVDPQALATMLLALIRGLEVLRIGGIGRTRITEAAEAALAVLA